MKSRLLFFTFIFALLLFLIAEILLRISLVFFGYPFLRPSDYLYNGFYENMNVVRDKPIVRGTGVKNILILGGSVVSTPWSHLESRLDTILQKHYGKESRFAIYNIAGAGHTSLDNVLKYKLLEDKQFDLVLYYEAINENRVNNIPPQHFRKDYTHVKWYRDIELLQRHREINVTVIPYLVDKLISTVRDRATHRIYVSAEKVNPQYVKFGGDIKTGESYGQNIEELIKIAQTRGEKLLLMSYASYFPQNVTLTGEQEDMKHFAGCYFASPVVIWGKPEHVKKGIDVHNQVIRRLSKQYDMLFLDMENAMPKDSSLFCDVCHVSEPGAQRFAHEIVEFIVRHKILE
jgi:hypothetical protein